MSHILLSIASVLLFLPWNNSFISNLPKSGGKLPLYALQPTKTVDETGQSLVTSELPFDFYDSVKRSVDSSVSCIKKTGSKKIRIDFDTTVGDMTYTSLKTTLPYVKEFLKLYCQSVGIAPATLSNVTETMEASSSEPIASETGPIATPAEEVPITKSMTIFFPDMGAAAYQRKEWKLKSSDSELPPGIYTSNIQNDPLMDTDIAAMIVCPQPSEADEVKRVVELCLEKNIPCLLVNPNLINMDQGFGVRARNYRRDLLDPFTTSYYLKTLRNGAVVREWPYSYTLWEQDEANIDGGGYSFLKNYATEPAFSEMEELFEELEEKRGMDKKKKNPIQSVIGEVTGFFKGMSRL